jgi:uncharacterized protein (DUF924 family)
MQASAILDFWFRELKPRQWFVASPKLDEMVRERFGVEVDAALRGERHAWADTPRGRLALILLLDQFTRNIHRGAAGAFAGDAEAQRLAREGVAAGMDKALGLEERHFFYMPLMHAEDSALQALSLERFSALVGEAQSIQAFAKGHAATIARFGRFPARNLALGRPSTAEEIAFLTRSRRKPKV